MYFHRQGMYYHFGRDFKKDSYSSKPKNDLRAHQTIQIIAHPRNGPLHFFRYIWKHMSV